MRGKEERDNLLKFRPLGQSALIPNSQAFLMGDCSIIVSRDGGRWHLSIAHPDRYPTWDEIHYARYELIPDGVFMAMITPPKKFYVNFHPNCFHWWEIKDKELIEIIKQK